MSKVWTALHSFGVGTMTYHYAWADDGQTISIVASVGDNNVVLFTSTDGGTTWGSSSVSVATGATCAAHPSFRNGLWHISETDADGLGAQGGLWEASNPVGTWTKNGGLPVTIGGGKVYLSGFAVTSAGKYYVQQKTGSPTFLEGIFRDSTANEVTTPTTITIFQGAGLYSPVSGANPLCIYGTASTPTTRIMRIVGLTGTDVTPAFISTNNDLTSLLASLNGTTWCGRYNHASGSNPDAFIRSADGGLTWTKVQNLSSTQFVEHIVPDPAVANQWWAQVDHFSGASHHRVWKSTDDGITWAESTAGDADMNASGGTPELIPVGGKAF